MHEKSRFLRRLGDVIDPSGRGGELLILGEFALLLQVRNQYDRSLNRIVRNGKQPCRRSKMPSMTGVVM